MSLLNLNPQRKVIVSRLQRAYKRSEIRKLQMWLKGKTLHWALYLTLASLLAGGLLSLHSYVSQFYYVVWVEDMEVGLVRDAEELDEFLDELMEKCSYLYGMEVNPKQNITLTYEYRGGGEADLEGVMEALRQRISLLTEAVMVTVDGSPVVPVSSAEEVDTVIELLSMAYVSPDEKVELLEVELTEEISGKAYEVAPEEVFTPEEVVALLTRQTLSPGTLTASREGMISRSGRYDFDIDPDLEIPVVHVRTVEIVTREERIPFTTTYVNTNNLYAGQSRVATSGADGRKEVTYQVTRENGEEVAREALSQKVTKEPVTQVVERGTGRRFTWPVASGGMISQYYRGAGHQGIDIAAPTGTAILAAESGTVVRSEYAWPMGNYIVIRHNNGYWTVYLHNSRNIVSVGQGVARGQTIGYVGSTGRSTGPHLHFEVRRSNGSGVWSSWTAHPPVNPMQFFR